MRWRLMGDLDVMAGWPGAEEMGDEDEALELTTGSVRSSQEEAV